MSDVVKNYGLFVAGGIVVIVVAVRRYISTDAGRRQMERAILGIPVLGQRHRPLRAGAVRAHARHAGRGRRAAGLVSLRTAREAIGNQTLADTVSHAIEEVQRGQALSKALGNSPKLFPPSVVETIAVAEETGRLDKELIRLAASYEGDLDRQLRLLVSRRRAAAAVHHGQRDRHDRRRHAVAGVQPAGPDQVVQWLRRRAPARRAGTCTPALAGRRGGKRPVSQPSQGWSTPERFRYVHSAEK